VLKRVTPPAAKEIEERLRLNLGGNVRSLRIAAGLTQQGAAERAAMHWRHWQKLERGVLNFTVRTLGRLALALGVDGEGLLCSPLPERISKRKGA